MNRNQSEWLRLASIGPFFLVATLIGYFIGNRWLDRLFDSFPLWTVVFSIFGVAAGFLNLFKEVALLNKADRERADEEAPKDSDRQGPS